MSCSSTHLLVCLVQRRTVQKGLLLFTRNVLHFPVAGGVKLVHFMILLTGISFAGESDRVQRVHSRCLFLWSMTDL
jgi:hypothetical protein